MEILRVAKKLLGISSGFRRMTSAPPRMGDGNLKASYEHPSFASGADKLLFLSGFLHVLDWLTNNVDKKDCAIPQT